MNTLPATTTKAALPERTLAIRQNYQTLLIDFNREMGTLRKRPLNQMTRAIAAGLDTIAKNRRAEIEKNRREMTAPYRKTFEQLQAIFHAIDAPYEDARKEISKLNGAIDAEERRAIAEENRRKEAEDLEHKLRERAEEIEHLQVQAVESGDETLQAVVEELKATPIQPTIAKAEEYKPVVSGYSTTEVKVGTVISLYKLMRWACESEARFEALVDLVEIRQSRLNYYVRHGMKFPEDAVEIGRDYVSRNASRE